MTILRQVQDLFLENFNVKRGESDGKLYDLQKIIAIVKDIAKKTGTLDKYPELMKSQFIKLQYVAYVIWKIYPKFHTLNPTEQSSIFDFMMQMYANGAFNMGRSSGVGMDERLDVIADQIKSKIDSSGGNLDAVNLTADVKEIKNAAMSVRNDNAYNNKLLNTTGQYTIKQIDVNTITDHNLKLDSDQTKIYQNLLSILDMSDDGQLSGQHINQYIEEYYKEEYPARDHADIIKDTKNVIGKFINNNIIENFNKFDVDAFLESKEFKAMYGVLESNMKKVMDEINKSSYGSGYVTLDSITSGKVPDAESDDEEEQETEGEKVKKLTKEYLERINTTLESGSEDIGASDDEPDFGDIDDIKTIITNEFLDKSIVSNVKKHNSDSDNYALNVLGVMAITLDDLFTELDPAIMENGDVMEFYFTMLVTAVYKDFDAEGSDFTDVQTVLSGSDSYKDVALKLRKIAITKSNLN